MTRQECEDRLLELMKQAEAVYKEFAPDGGRLDMTTCDGHTDITGYRRDYNEDSTLIGERFNVYVVQFDDGEVWHMDKWLQVSDEVSE